MIAEDTLARPGLVLLDKELYNPTTTIFGIIIPKEKFIQEFIQEKGMWTTGAPYTREMVLRYGPHLPFKMNGGSLHKLGSMYDFTENAAYIGIKVLGKVVSPTLERKLGFEMIKYTGQLCFNDLELFKTKTVIQSLIPTYETIDGNHP